MEPTWESVTGAFCAFIVYNRWLLCGTAADDRGRVSSVCSRGRKDSRGTVHGTDRVHVPDGCCGGRRGLRAPRSCLRWRVRHGGGRLRGRWLHASARHAAVARHADQEQKAAGELGKFADHGFRAIGRRTESHAEESQLSQRPMRWIEKKKHVVVLIITIIIICVPCAGAWNPKGCFRLWNNVSNYLLFINILIIYSHKNITLTFLPLRFLFLPRAWSSSTRSKRLVIAWALKRSTETEILVIINYTIPLLMNSIIDQLASYWVLNRIQI